MHRHPPLKIYHVMEESGLFTVDGTRTRSSRAAPSSSPAALLPESARSTLTPSLALHIPHGFSLGRGA